MSSTTWDRHALNNDWWINCSYKMSKRQHMNVYTNKTAFIQPSFSGLLVTWAYLPEMHEITIHLSSSNIILITLQWLFSNMNKLQQKYLFKKQSLPQITFPPCVTRPSSLTFTCKRIKTFYCLYLSNLNIILIAENNSQLNVDYHKWIHNAISSLKNRNTKWSTK